MNTISDISYTPERGPWYVSATSGSDSDNGLSVANAKATLAGAVAAASSGSTYGDTIVMLPGSHTVSADVSLPAGVRLLGIGWMSKIVLTGSAVAITPANDTFIGDLQFDNTGATTGADGIFNRNLFASERVLFKNCLFRAKESAFKIGSASTDIHWIIQNCVVHAGVSCLAVDAGAFVTGQVSFRDCQIRCNATLRGANTAIYMFDVANGGLSVHGCDLQIVQTSDAGNAAYIFRLTGNSFTQVAWGNCTGNLVSLNANTLAIMDKSGSGPFVISDGHPYDHLPSGMVAYEGDILRGMAGALLGSNTVSVGNATSVYGMRGDKVRVTATQGSYGSRAVASAMDLEY